MTGNRYIFHKNITYYDGYDENHHFFFSKELIKLKWGTL